ncbi:MAG: M15 family metallopeptidase [Clostridiaceae bacterium]
MKKRLVIKRRAVMKRRLVILLLGIGLITARGFSKGFDFTHSTKLLTTRNTSFKNTSKSKSNILLVNRSNRLDKDHVPQSLTTPNVRFISYADNRVKKMDTTAAKALENLFNAAEEDGVNLLAVSGYRAYSYQEMLYNNKVAAAGRVEADKYVAQPGASEHNTGLAMDVLSDEYSSLDEGFEQTEAYKWLEDNCYKYGFIIRYLRGKEDITGYNYEPWHLRYVGVSEATEISEEHITLEEYLNKVE